MSRTPITTVVAAAAFAVSVAAQILPGFGSRTSAEGQGIAVGQVGGQTTPDLVYGVFTAGAFEYRIGFDPDGAGQPTSSSPVYRITAPFTGLSPASAQGADVAIGRVGGDSRPDLVVTICWNRPGANYMRCAVGYDLDATGRARTWSPLMWGPSFGWESQGAGCALGDINRDGRTDLLLMANDNPTGQNQFRYAVGWSLGTNGAPASWSATQCVAGVSYEAQGAAAYLTQLDRDPRPELILAAQDDGGTADTFRYRIGWNLGSDGAATRWGEVAHVHGPNRRTFGLGMYGVPASGGDLKLVFAAAYSMSSDPEFAAIGLATSSAVCSMARRYRLVGDVHAITTTEQGTNNRDETYLKVQERYESALTRRESNKTARICDPWPEDYFKFFNGVTYTGLVIWEGVLYPDDRTVLTVAMMEQDNAQRQALLNMLPNAANALNGMQSANSVAGWLTAGATFGLALAADLVRSADSLGDDFIGALGVSLANDQGRICARFHATQFTTLTAGTFDASVVSVDFSGVGHYRVSNLRVEDVPMLADDGFEEPVAIGLIAQLAVTQPGVVMEAAEDVLENDWAGAVDELLGAFDSPSQESAQQIVLRHLPAALRECGRRAGRPVHLPNAYGTYDANANRFVAEPASLARVRRIVDLTIARESNMIAWATFGSAVDGRSWGTAAQRLLLLVRRHVEDRDLSDASRLIVQHMPYALRYTWQRFGGIPLGVTDPALFSPFRSWVTAWR